MVLSGFASERQRHDSSLPLGPGRPVGSGSPGRPGVQTSLKEPVPEPPPLSKIAISRYQPFGATRGISLLSLRAPARTLSGQGLRTELGAYGARTSGCGPRLPEPPQQQFSSRRSTANVCWENAHLNPAALKPGTQEEMEPGPGYGEGRWEKGQEEGLQTSGSEDRTQGETSRGRERGCTPASRGAARIPRAAGAQPATGAGEGTRAAAGPAPRRDGGGGSES